MNLPPELLRHILFCLDDVECFDTVGFQPSALRYKEEIARGHKNVKTKSALLQTSRTFQTISIELAWSWISIYSEERLRWMDAVLDGLEIPPSVRLARGGGFEPDKEKKGVDGQLIGCWIRRLDLQLGVQDYNNSTIPSTIGRLLVQCPNLNVFVSDITPGQIDCQRTSSVILQSLKSLRHLTRLDFSGHEGPSLGDYVELLPHLLQLEQWTTGRIAAPRLGDDELMDILVDQGRLEERVATIDENQRTSAISLPRLKVLQVSHRPLYSCLRLFVHFDLPELCHISFRHLDFHAPRMKVFFQAFGAQITHLSTHEIRTGTAPFGYAFVLQLCPNLEHMTFSPRLRDDRYEEDWAHDKLETIGLRSVLPSTVPEEEQLAQNINQSINAFLSRIVQAVRNGALPSLVSITFEDHGHGPKEYQDRFGLAWATSCAEADVRLLDSTGRSLVEPAREADQATPIGQPVYRGRGKLKRPRIVSRVVSFVTGKEKGKRQE